MCVTFGRPCWNVPHAVPTCEPQVFSVDFLRDFYANELRPLHALSPGRRAGYRDIGGIDVLDLDSRNERNLKVQNQ